MRFALATTLVLLHTLFWGLGLAWWVTPRVWRRYWLLLVPLCGWTLQSAVVWIGTWAGLAGTNAYGVSAQLVPLALLITAVAGGALRRFRTAARVAAPAYGVLVLAVIGYLLPLALASERLTTQSWGSCDAADYAAGARVFQEFARSDRTGFLGLTEVAGVGSTDNFSAFWLRLNHFTPSAVLALANAVFGFQLHETVGFVTVLFVATLAPAAFFAARLGLRLRPGLSALVAAATTLGPVMGYAVAHVAMAQVLAAQAVAVLGAVALGLWRVRGRGAKRYVPLLVVVYSLLLGAYNFILLVALAPAAAVVLLDWRRRGWIADAGRWGLALVAPLLAAAVFWWDRAGGIVERFRLFRGTDFGWPVPLTTPDALIGFARGVDLEPLSFAAQVALSVGAAVLVGLALARSRRGSRVRLCVAAAVPVLLGYGYLQVRGAVFGTNASYDAYKILAVFLPFVLAALLVPLWELSAKQWRWVGTLVICVGLTSHLTAFAIQFRRAPYLVTPDIPALQALETRGDIQGLNMRIEDFWTRLWANAFLLRKPQYFEITTYEGRAGGALRGSHDLCHGVLSPSAQRVQAGSGTWPAVADWGGGTAAKATLTRAPFCLLPAGTLGLSWENGWHGFEGSIRSGPGWRWAGQHADVSSTAPRDVKVDFLLRIRSDRTDVLVLSNDDGWTCELPVAGGLRDYELRNVPVPQGVHRWRIEARAAPFFAPGDPRPLTVAVYRWEWVVLNSVDASASDAKP
ncbi:hypothetical protein [Nibricoccus sp. IMCC34717]|uniref:hypothetical protein n=1 Tax=Nibricoccus sp. IMCC34717 TaxID=3034021 RepID=UPI00384CA7BE